MATPHETLYQRAMGAAFSQLHPTLQAFHGAAGGALATGNMEVERGKGFFRNILATIMGFPPAAAAVRVDLCVEVLGERERWARSFGDHALNSLQYHAKGLLIERAGPVSLGLQLSSVDGNLRMELARVWCLGVPVPLWLAPHVLATTQADEGGWQIETTIQMRGIGLLVRYNGYMVPSTKREMSPH